MARGTERYGSFRRIADTGIRISPWHGADAAVRLQEKRKNRLLSRPASIAEIATAVFQTYVALRKSQIVGRVKNGNIQ